MTQLLGSQDCVESLRKDLIDLQGTVVDVFSRTGAVLYPSWKFPDKLSCSLDLVNLLEQYDYVEGETDMNQLSHVVLLELLIDRLMLLLQSFNVYTETILRGQRAGNPGQAGPSVSLGPVVKRYWNNLVQLSSQKQHMLDVSKQRGRGEFVQQFTSSECQRCSSHSHSHSDTSTSTRAAHNPKTPNRRNAVMNASLTLKHKAPNFSKSSPKISGPAPSRAAPPAGEVRTRTCSVSCQTAESALAPCETCTCVQLSLKESASAVVLMYRSLGLTCSLQHLLVALEDTVQLGRLSTCNVQQWAEIQRRDMGRLGEHVMEIQEAAEALKDRLSKTEEEKERLREQLKQEDESAKKERGERRRREEEWESKLQEVKEKGKQEERKQQEQQEELRRGAAALEKKIHELTEQLKLHTQAQRSLERERDSLLEEVHRLRQLEERRKRLEVELSNTHTLLEKERAKCNSSQHQNQAFQVKQQALLERVSALFQQCEDLQTRLQECEDKRAEHTDTLTHITQERDVLLHQLTQQKSQCVALHKETDRQRERVCELEECVSRLNEDLEHAGERERTLVAFPEFKQQTRRQARPQASGDVFHDMEQQMKANCIRIRLLEKENASLSNNLAKVKLAHPDARLADPLSSQVQGELAGAPFPTNLEKGDGGGCAATSVTAATWRTCPSSSSASRPHKPGLHIPAVCLPIKPSAEETYNNIRRAARVCSAGVRRRRR